MVAVPDQSSAAACRNPRSTEPKSTWTETNRGPVRCPTSGTYKYADDTE